MPLLFVSPVLTVWIQHDIIVYLCVLTIFLFSLLLGARRIISQWSTFYLKIPAITDVELLDWYTKKLGKKSLNLVEGIDGEEIMPQARREFHAAVLKDSDRHFWTQSTKDPLVAKMAAAYASTIFLMNWFCKFKRTKLPLPYSTTWNLTVTAAIEMMTNMQKGLKLHSAFLHWRHTGADIWASLLYFVVALMDKWVSLFTGGGLVGLSAAASSEYHWAVGFGLCYYLIGAVSLDAVSLPLWTAANETTVQPITSVEFLRQATTNDKRARRALYWKNLTKFFFLHIWGLSITSALMWTFEASRDATIMFVAYVGAYTGLLWYQYNKIFCGNNAGKSLGLASVCGFPVGLALHFTLPHFPYSGVIGLATGTWIAAFHTIFISKIGLPTIILSAFTNATANDQQNDFKTAPAVFSCSSLEPYPELSQKTLSQTFETIGAISAELRFKLDPTQHPGMRVMEILRSRKSAIRPQIVENAFPSAEELLDQTTELWKCGKIVVDLVSVHDFPQFEQKLRTISRKADGLLNVTIVLPSDSVAHEWTMDIHRNYKIIAEAIIQAACEHQLSLSHDHAMLAELLAVDESSDDNLQLPEGIKRQLETSSAERTRAINNGEKVLLRHLLLGIDCDTEWDNMPNNVRSFFLKRMCGQNVTIPYEVDQWISSRFCDGNRLNISEYIARSKLAATLTASVISYAKMLEESNSYLIGGEETDSPDFGFETLIGSPPPACEKNTGSFVGKGRYAFSRLLQKVEKCIKFFVLALTADPEYQRELDYVLRGKVGIFRWPVTIFLNGVWSICKALQGLVIPLVFFHDRNIVAKLDDNLKGMKTVIEKNRIIVESLSGSLTCFTTSLPDGAFELFQYSGRHDEEPSDLKQLVAINNYSNRMDLLQRREYRGEKVCNVFNYEYPAGKTRGLRLPVQRECVEGDLKYQIVQYDDRGYINMGSTFRGVNPVDFTYWYRKSAKFEDELLRGEYVLPHITIRVNWSMPPRNNPDRMDNWIPFSKVAEATFVQGQDIYHATWDYEHKFHPDIFTTLNGNPVMTPPMIKEDWFHVLQKPEKCGFLSDNPLLSFSSPRSNIISRLLGLNKKRYLIPTSHARTQLWQTWKTSNEVDAITARWLDERILRSDKILRKYWRHRDFGFHNAAKKYLDVHADTIMARVDVDQLISSWTHIAFKMSDFYSFGQGGDSRINTRTLQGQLQDDYDELHVLAMDTSTWPNDPGGVSACRRDMVNDLKTIKWNIVAESANDYGVPKFQIEKNVQSLMILPLWGLDFMNPTHGILEGNLDSAVAQRSFETNTVDIKKYFIPILTSFVKLARTRRLGRKHIEEATKALVDLNTYFETSRNWNDVWSSDIVKQTWRELWLTEEMEDTLGVSEWWDFEKPTITELDNALNMWQRYLFIFSIPVPEKIPDVFQASHHFTGATYGILCKIKRKCTLHIWDHCISYRELTVFLSSGVSFDTPFVNSSLISLSHLACVLLEHHADVVLPCAEYFNPGWEIELGTSENLIEHRRLFARKIDPVVNGINNMEKFKPIKAIKTDKPTVVMLSHVQYPKDIKSAIMAVDFIVNKWGFKDYRLHIYGNKERMASYCTECQELIASKGLQEQCVLKGFGNPSVVLQDAWLFLNSSISEGLPLAMGEAALTGVPVVCTDVGASFCVVTDRATGAKFSEVVPPNDPEMLARAQINILALLGQWSAFADDAPGTQVPVLSYPNPTPQDVEQITERMYAKTEQRRAVGMLGRENVFKNFSADRYLREHEQMLWIGKHRSRSYNIQRSLAPSTISSSEWVSEKSMSSDYSVKKPRRKPRLTAESWTSLPRPVSLISTLRPTLLSAV
jgi:glycosyltransferase involved in cell wall biosynthesis